MKKTKIAILGGDLRNLTVAKNLLKYNFDINIFGIENFSQRLDEASYCQGLDEVIDGVEYVLLPLPASVDGFTLNTPLLQNKSISLSEIVDTMSPSICLLGGKIPKGMTESAIKKGIQIIDYFTTEDFQIKNAYITAEAAVSIAMNSLDRTLKNAKIAITGYGRISKQLVALLKAFDADVTVAARSASDLCWADSSGCSILNIGTADAKERLYEFCEGYDVIYNTVPTWLFDRSFLEKMDKRTFLIDLASAPGGVDICAAKELEKNVLWATSLPGKYAPESAGELIGECVRKIIMSRGRVS